MSEINYHRAIDFLKRTSVTTATSVDLFPFGEGFILTDASGNSYFISHESQRTHQPAKRA